MFVAGLGIFVFAIVYWIVLPSTWRRGTLTLVSLVCLGWYAPASTIALGVLSGMVFALIRPAPGRGGWGTPVAIVISLALLLAHKYLRLLPTLLGFGIPSWVIGAEEAKPFPRLLGVSYAVFRLIHVAVESSRGKVQLSTFWRFLEYTLFPPSFLSGPIERYGRFEAGVQNSHLSLDGAFWASRRILTGLVKKVFIVEQIRVLMVPCFTNVRLLSTGQAWEGLLLNSLFIYLDFSAYCDLALGVARLFGYSLSENFDWPYLAPNITEFWRRWHITLSEWLRDYVYLPFSVLASRVRMIRDRPLLTGSLAAIVTMLACGLWHGDSLAFVLWGLGHGVLCALHQSYRQIFVGQLKVKQRKALAASISYRMLCTGATFLAVSWLWIVFRLQPAEALTYYRRLLGLG